MRTLNEKPMTVIIVGAFVIMVVAGLILRITGNATDAPTQSACVTATTQFDTANAQYGEYSSQVQDAAQNYLNACHNR